MRTRSFFILGNPRSGTSLFRSLLNAQPGIVVPPECGFVLWLHDNWVNADWTRDQVLRNFAEAVQNCRKFETRSVTTEELFNALKKEPLLGFKDAVACVYQAYGNARGMEVTCWGDKNNYYIGRVQELVDLFPDSRFVHLVRDVRDVACSYIELASAEISSKYKPVLSVDPKRIAEEWRSNNQSVLDSLGANKTAHSLVRYEDLVFDVEGTLAGVLSFLGMRNEGSVTADAHLGILDEPSEFMQWKKKLAGPVDSSSVGRYKKDLPVSAIEKIEEICGPMLDRFGYRFEV